MLWFSHALTKRVSHTRTGARALRKENEKALKEVMKTAKADAKTAIYRGDHKAAKAAAQLHNEAVKKLNGSAR